MTIATFEKIMNSTDLPTPTGVALKLMELSMDENSTIDRIAELVELDPAISSRLLKIVNSPLSGMTRQVASVSRAVSLVGVRMVSSLALSFSLIQDHSEGRCEGFDYDLFWSEAIARACTARHIAHILKNFAPDEAFTCGLLSTIGKLVLASVFPESYSEALRMLDNDDEQELIKIEHTMFDVDHNELSARMMEVWHIPVIFCDAVRYHGNPDIEDENGDICDRQLARILHLAGSFSYILTRSTIYRDTLSSLVLEANQLGISPEVCHEVFDAITQEWRDSGAIFSVKTHRVPTLAELYSQTSGQADENSQPDIESVSCDL